MYSEYNRSGAGAADGPTGKNDLTLAITIAHPLLARSAPMREAHGHTHTGTSKLARSAPSHMLPSVAVCLFTAFT